MDMTCGLASPVWKRRRAEVILVLASAFIGLLWPTHPSSARAWVGGSEAGPGVAPIATLPPRVTAVPQPVTQSSASLAAAIHLIVQVSSPTLSVADLWAEVEWLDSTGVWHTVEGWQGPLDGISGNTGSATWYLGPQALGTGPFRWVLYDGRGGALLSSSAPFALPTMVGTTVTVEMQESPPPLLPRSGGVAIAVLAAGMAIVACAAVIRVVSLRLDLRRET